MLPTATMLATPVSSRNPGGPLASWDAVSLLNQPGDAAFPITGYEYFLLRQVSRHINIPLVVINIPRHS